MTHEAPLRTRFYISQHRNSTVTYGDGDHVALRLGDFVSRFGKCLFIFTDGRVAKLLRHFNISTRPRAYFGVFDYSISPEQRGLKNVLLFFFI